MPAIFITGTGTDIGKTYVAAALIAALTRANIVVDALKPVVSGFDADAPLGSDPAVLLAALGIPFSTAALQRIAPFRYRAPLAPPMAAALEGRPLDGDDVIRLCQARIDEADGRRLLIEGAGGVMSPLDDTRTMLDLAVALNVPAILVAGTYLGTISHTLTAYRALAARGVNILAIVLSESADPGPSVRDTHRAIMRYLPEVKIVVIGRNRGWEGDDLTDIGVT